ncbi:MAG TPA: NHL repeat-containing protein [Candidatus Baltobacteraceae bacterium]|nr:NHL repeat-containing protein [Candidatus Baltobacteraceae bacterium]
MRHFLSLRPAYGAAALTIALAACAGSGSQLNPQSPQSRFPSAVSRMQFSPLTGALLRSGPVQVQNQTRTAEPAFSSFANSTGKLYVSDYAGNKIVIYPAAGKNQKPSETITTGIAGPLGNFVDAKGTLYVVNSNNSTVTEYPAGASKPSKTFSKGLSLPIGVVVDPLGTVYVSEFSANSIVEFDKGATSPSRTISISQPEGLWLDNAENLYASYIDPSNNGRVMKFKHKSTTGKDLGIAVGPSGDVKLDPNGNLLLGDQINFAIDVFKPGTTTPFRTISTSGNNPYKFAFNSGATLIYVAAPNSNTVPVFNYTSGTLVNTITQGLSSAYGASLSPPEPFGKPF